MIRRKSFVERLEPRQLLSASMVKDLNTQPALVPGFWGAASADDTVFLSHEDGVAGWELYKTDGTTAGTVLVKDIRPGRDNSAPSWITQLSGGTVLFTADDGTNGIELWKSDGTTAGTVLLKDINPGAASSGPSNLLNINGTIYFSAGDATNGVELWKSDGTPGGTVMVKNISTGSSGSAPNSSSPSLLVNNDGVLFFRASTSTTGAELWKSDGTDAGTVMVKEINSGTSSGVAANTPMAARGGYVYFAGTTSASGTELWRSNGTDAGTTLVKEIYSSSTSSSPGLFTTSGNYVYFNVASGASPGLYRTDGTDAGTIRLFTSSISTGVDLNGSFVFSQGIPATPPAQPTRLGLYKTDGNTVTTINASLTMAGNTSAWRVVNGTIYFTANTPATGEELWKSDGTAGGTQMVADVEAGTANSNPSGITPYGVGGASGIIFSSFTAPSTGGAIYRSNGTAAGTAFVKDINPSTGDSSPLALTPFKNWVYYMASEPTYSNGTIGELYRTDGTEAGTGIGVDLMPGPTGATVGAPKVMGDWLYFPGNNGSGIGKELWRTDGSTTQLVKDINSGTPDSGVGGMTVSGSFLYFWATTAAEGEELWRTDGTNAGTLRMSNNLAIGTTIDLPTDVDGTLYYTVENSSGTFTGLWKSNGFGVTQLTTSFTSVSSMINVNGTLFIAASTGGSSTLWKIAPGGSTPTQVSTASTLASSPNFTNVGGTLFYSATASGSGTELWKSDGTLAGTVMVKDINPSSSSSSPTSFAAANGVVYFRATDSNGSELWRSDGTNAGTYMVKDITPAGATSGLPSRMFAANGFVYFAANDYNNITPDVWRTDGTAAGTVPITRFPRGAFLSFPSTASFFVAMGGDVYFSFTDDTHGAEVWKSEQPDFATLAGGGALTLSGTGGNDEINLSTDVGGNLIVTLNGLTESFAPGTVTTVTIAGHVGTDTVNVNSGAVAFAGDSGATTANLTLRVASGASATFHGTQHIASLVLDGGTATLAPDGDDVLVLGGLSVSGAGTLDLTDNVLILRGGNLATVVGLIGQGFNGGTWNGTGGINSSAAATDPNGFTSLGYLSNADLGATEFAGVPVNPDDVLVKYTYYGDADLSGTVTLDDYSQFLFGFQNPVPGAWSVGDFDHSGTVTLDDFSVFLLVFQNQGGPL